MPATKSPFLPPLAVHVWPLGGAKSFSLTPYISVTLGNFPEIFWQSDTSPQALPNPLSSPTNSTSGLGVGPPTKISLTPNYTKSGFTISLIFGSLIRRMVPLRSPKFGENLTTGFSARWRQSFSLTPNISLTLGSFAKKFSLPYTSPLALQIPSTSAANSTSGLGVGPPEKNFWPPITQNSLDWFRCFFGTVIRPGVLLRSPKFG